jgi:proteic killer suppression protein
MEVVFRTRKLQKASNSEELLEREYGAENGRLIMRRLTVLKEADSLADVPRDRPDRCHQLEGKRKDQFAVDLKHPFRLVFEPAHDSLPRRGDGGLDLVHITSICILDIEDYHK